MITSNIVSLIGRKLATGINATWINDTICGSVSRHQALRKFEELSFIYLKWNTRKSSCNNQKKEKWNREKREVKMKTIASLWNYNSVGKAFGILPATGENNF